ncbi:hypothetical protein A2165_03955 [Candidatus Curtissbacteria bacterium RBG_13_40_7]|uniref:DUF2178 domain-containing protein n=1 Tax=Candidatus Curtissbacteria bacterium RBG_13_40_7 TaxID=1797706 RepID=A0A1F5FVC0_9BACT|nr:MAG: hypothetical protein A2165_03955 [Candidatus Curtissbacteria bacterium RBG_13_40_7]
MFVMDRKKYKQLRIVVALFVGAIVAMAVTRHSYLLSIAGVLTGMVFMALVRAKAKIRTDEREATVQEKAARMTYAIFAPTIGVAAFLLLLPSKGGISVFSKGEWLYIESLGMVFAYLTLFLIAIYAISYHFFNRKYGGGGNEE